MKRILAFSLALFLLVALLAVPAGAITNTVHGISADVSGITQTAQFEYYESVASGYTNYNGHVLKTLPTVSGKPYVIIVNNSGFYDAYFSPIPFVVSSGTPLDDGIHCSRGYVYVSSLSGTSVTDYNRGISTGTWTRNSTTTKYFQVGSTAGTVAAGSKVIWSSHDIIFNYSLYCEAGGTDTSYEAADGLIAIDGTASSSATLQTRTYSFAPGDYVYLLRSSDDDFLFYTETNGDVNTDGIIPVSYTISDPYIDLSLAQTGSDVESVSVNGRFLSDIFIGLKLGDTYLRSDLYPNSLQILVNGSPVGDIIEIDTESVPAGYHFVGSEDLSESLSTKYAFDNLLIPLDVASDITTVGVRLYIVNSLGLETESMQIESSAATAAGYIALDNLIFPTFTLNVAVDPDPEPSETIDPDPEPTETADPEPEPSETTDPDPDPSETTDPDPDPTETTDPDPEPSESEPVEFDPSGMGVLAAVITGAVNLLKIEISIMGFTFSLWEMLLFDMIAGVILYLVWRFLL